MAFSISASTMHSQPAAMIPQAQISDAGRISRSPQDDPIKVDGEKSSNLNSIPSRSIPDITSASTGSQTNTSSNVDQSEQERLNQQKVEQVISQLKARDREVRAHEAAHLAAAGSYATSGASYSYQTGPDGKSYAIGGTVGIDVAPIANDPQATLQKAQVVQQAALAPAQPSAQDMRVASAAAQMMTEARAQLSEQQNNEQTVTDSKVTTDSATTSNSNNQAQQIVSAQQDESALATSSSGSLSMISERSQFELRMSLNGLISG